MKPPPSDPYCKFCGSDSHYANRDCPSIKQNARGEVVIPEYWQWHSTKNGIGGYVLCKGQESRDSSAEPPPGAKPPRVEPGPRRPVTPPTFVAPPMPEFRGAVPNVAPPPPKYHPQAKRK